MTIIQSADETIKRMAKTIEDLRTENQNLRDQMPVAYTQVAEALAYQKPRAEKLEAENKELRSQLMGKGNVHCSCGRLVNLPDVETRWLIGDECHSGSGCAWHTGWHKALGVVP